LTLLVQRPAVQGIDPLSGSNVTLAGVLSLRTTILKFTDSTVWDTDIACIVSSVNQSLLLVNSDPSEAVPMPRLWASTPLETLETAERGTIWGFHLPIHQYKRHNFVNTVHQPRNKWASEQEN